MAELRSGFTTGSCSAAAAKAAACMLLGGRIIEKISITTPKGVVFDAEIVDIKRSDNTVSCAVVKDGGDDPDITTGARIYASVTLDETFTGIEIDGGEGVGRVNAPGLDQQVGMAAINHVPRQMILDEVGDVAGFFDYHKGLKVIISVPGGEELAKKTFNPRLGIVGGISILGTSGVVEPMSEKALLDTIRVELKQKKITEGDTVIISPGNYGRAFMREAYGYEIDKSVKCSNYIGLTIDMAREMGFKRVLLVGHIGKLIKLSGGIMNTHSKEADSRMELMAAAALKAGAGTEVLLRILECVNTEQAADILSGNGLLTKTMDIVMDKAMFYLKKRAGEELETECMMYSSVRGLLGKSKNAEMIIEEMK